MPRANAAPGLPRGLARETDSGPKASPLVHSTAKSGKMRVPRRASRHAAACLPRGLARETRKWHEGPWVSCHPCKPAVRASRCRAGEPAPCRYPAQPLLRFQGCSPDRFPGQLRRGIQVVAIRPAHRQSRMRQRDPAGLRHVGDRVRVSGGQGALPRFCEDGHVRPTPEAVCRGHAPRVFPQQERRRHLHVAPPCRFLRSPLQLRAGAVRDGGDGHGPRRLPAHLGRRAGKCGRRCGF